MERRMTDPSMWRTPGGEWVISPHDQLGGGTWVGLSKFGNIAALTNFRNCSPVPEELRTRGALVLETLEGKFLQKDGIIGRFETPYADCQKVDLGAPTAGFNMVYAQAHKMDEGEDHLEVRFMSNRCPKEYVEDPYWVEPERGYASVGVEEAIVTRELDDGVYCVSNAGLNDFSWPKVSWLQAACTKAIDSIFETEESASSETEAARVVHSLEPLFMTPNVPIAPPSEETYSWSPVSPKEEEFLDKGPFVTNKDRDSLHEAYGSRSLSIIVRAQGQNHFFFKSFDQAQLDAPERERHDDPDPHPEHAPPFQDISSSAIPLDPEQLAEHLATMPEPVFAAEQEAPLKAAATPWTAYKF